MSSTVEGLVKAEVVRLDVSSSETVAGREDNLALLARPTSELERYVRDLGGPRVWADSERFG